jgi:GT2 family glycosyltransferase
VRRPAVSVCITHHDRQAWLEVALESIRRQDYPGIEVVVVDDGSTSPEAVAFLDSLAPEFRRRGWRLLRQPNRYVGAARNAAIRASRGEWVLIMDDDNVARPDEVSTFVRAATASGADVLTCLLHVFQSASPVVEPTPGYVWPFLGGALVPGVRRNVFGDANAFIRRQAFDRLGGFTEDYGVSGEDWELLARAVLAGLQVEVVPEALVGYRQNPQGMLHSTSDRANRRRALRPYLQLLPPHVRALTHLAGEQASLSTATSFRLDHVRRAVVFGSGAASRVAIDLARRCGWSVPWLVDNNPAAWQTTAHGLTVRGPEALQRGGFDLVIVASLAGKPAIFAQLSKLGLKHGEHFVHFLDQVQVGALATQVRL